MTDIPHENENGNRAFRNRDITNRKAGPGCKMHRVPLADFRDADYAARI